MTSATEIKRKVMASVRKSRVHDLEHHLKALNLKWFDCVYANGDTPLHVAAKEGNITIMKHLLESLTCDGNHVDIPNAAGKTPLHEACQNAQPEAVKYLLSQGANCRAIKQADWTPLMLVCTRKGQNALECSHTLIQEGGSLLLGDKNKDGWNAFHIATREGDTSMVKALLERDPSQVMICSKNGRTPLHTAALHGCCEVVKVLLDCTLTNYNARDSCGSTPLHDAVRSGNIEIVKMLLQAGADLTAINNQANGVLHMAAEVGQNEMLEFLCKKLCVLSSCEVNQPASTPLHCAVRCGQIKAAQILLNYGANPSAKDVWGRTSKDLIPERISKEDYNTLKQLLT